MFETMFLGLFIIAVIVGALKLFVAVAEDILSKMTPASVITIIFAGLVAILIYVGAESSIYVGMVFLMWLGIVLVSGIAKKSKKSKKPVYVAPQDPAAYMPNTKYDDFTIKKNDWNNEWSPDNETARYVNNPVDEINHGREKRQSVIDEVHSILDGK